MLHAVLRRWVSPALAWLLAALFASTPMVQLVTGSLFVENLLTAMIFGAMVAIWSFGEPGERRFLYAAGALGGTAMAIKVRRHRVRGAGAVCRRGGDAPPPPDRPAARWMFALALLVMAAAPPYAIAWFKTGNPLFPFLNDRFHSRLLEPKAEIQDTALSPSAHLEHALRPDLPQQRHYEGQDGSFGFQYLVLAPMALLALLVAPRRRAVAAAFVALTAIAADPALGAQRALSLSCAAAIVRAVRGAAGLGTGAPARAGARR